MQKIKRLFSRSRKTSSANTQGSSAEPAASASNSSQNNAAAAQRRNTSHTEATHPPVTPIRCETTSFAPPVLHSAQPLLPTCLTEARAAFFLRCHCSWCVHATLCITAIEHNSNIMLRATLAVTHWHLLLAFVNMNFYVCRLRRWTAISGVGSAAESKGTPEHNLWSACASVCVCAHVRVRVYVGACACAVTVVHHASRAECA